MAATIEEILISVWRQALVEEARTVTVGGESFPVRRTSRCVVMAPWKTEGAREGKAEWPWGGGWQGGPA